MKEDFKKEFIAVANKYISAFEKKHDCCLEFWVGDEVGGTACFGDVMYLSFDDIRFDIDNKIPTPIIFDWLYDNLDEHHNAENENRKERYINLTSYNMGLRFKDLAVKI